MIDFARVRRTMVDHQLRTYDITDLGILAAMNEIPRELFTPDDQRLLAYSDQPVEVAGGEDGGRWLLPPMIFGRLVQNLRLRAGEKTLVVGGGLGYEAVVLARLGAVVTLLEPDDALAARTCDNLAAVSAEAIEVVVGPIAAGWPAAAPFDVIFVNGAAQMQPQPLLDQLADGGRLGIVMGDGSRTSRATVFVRSGAVVGSRAVFDAAAPVLSAFREEPRFVF